MGVDSRLRLRPHDHIWLLRRACCHWRPHTKVGVLVCLHVFLLVHRLRAPRWPCSRNRRRTQPRNRKEDWHSASHDGDQLVHVSYCVFVPNARHFGGKKQWCPSNWATVRRTLSRNAELALSSTKSLMQNPASSIFCNEHLHAMASLAFASFSSRTDTFNFYC